MTTTLASIFYRRWHLVPIIRLKCIYNGTIIYKSRPTTVEVFVSWELSSESVVPILITFSIERVLDWCFLRFLTVTVFVVWLVTLLCWALPCGGAWTGNKLSMTLHAWTPSIQVWVKFGSPASPHFWYQAPPWTQQLSLPDFFTIPHLGHLLLLIVGIRILVVVGVPMDSWVSIWHATRTLTTLRINPSSLLPNDHANVLALVAGIIAVVVIELIVAVRNGRVRRIEPAIVNDYKCYGLKHYE